MAQTEAPLLADALADQGRNAFITCNSSAGRYWVDVQFRTLDETQEFHRALIQLVAARAQTEAA